MYTSTFGKRNPIGFVVSSPFPRKNGRNCNLQPMEKALLVTFVAGQKLLASSETWQRIEKTGSTINGSPAKSSKPLHRHVLKKHQILEPPPKNQKPALPARAKHQTTSPALTGGGSTYQFLLHNLIVRIYNIRPCALGRTAEGIAAAEVAAGLSVLRPRLAV